jgi:hypothetical protein
MTFVSKRIVPDTNVHSRIIPETIVPETLVFRK